MKRQKGTIAIIGATGKMGSALAKRLAGSDYRLLLFGRNKQKLRMISKEITAMGGDSSIDSSECQVDACWEADIIIPAVPFEVEKEIAGCIKQVATQKIVISISNPFNKNFDGLVTDDDTSAGEIIQQLIPDSKVVKAFNTVFATEVENGLNGQRTRVYIAGNDTEALTTVAEIAEQAGFDPVITGYIKESRNLESIALEKVRGKVARS